MARPLRTAAVLVAAGLLAAACGSSTTTTDIDPVPTVTVTVTEAPDDAPPASGGDDAAGEAASDPCTTLPDNADQLAFIFVTTPRPADVVSSPFLLTGCSNTFEATYLWRLLDRDGNVLAEGFDTASCGTGCVGTFSTEVEFEVGAEQVGSLEVFTESAEDGGVQDLNVIPLVLQP